MKITRKEKILAFCLVFFVGLIIGVCSGQYYEKNKVKQYNFPTQKGELPKIDLDKSTFVTKWGKITQEELIRRIQILEVLRMEYILEKRLDALVEEGGNR